MECDEYEQGRKQSGIHSHETHVGEIWGIWDQKSRKCYLEMHTKDSKIDKGEHRFGPPTQNEAQPLVRRVIETGFILFTDGAKAYVSLCDDHDHCHMSHCDES